MNLQEIVRYLDGKKYWLMGMSITLFSLVCLFVYLFKKKTFKGIIENKRGNLSTIQPEKRAEIATIANELYEPDEVEEKLGFLDIQPEWQIKPLAIKNNLLIRLKIVHKDTGESVLVSFDPYGIHTKEAEPDKWILEFGKFNRIELENDIALLNTTLLKILNPTTDDGSEQKNN